MTLHADYVKFIAENHTLPVYNGRSGAERHPPLYYVISAVFYRFGEWAGDQNPFQYVRYFSMILYLAFILFGALTVRAVFTPITPEYYVGLLLLAFWPVGVTKSGVIHCDVMEYAAQMAVIYYLIRWIQSQNVHILALAFVSAGIAVLAKSIGALMLIITVSCFLYGLFLNRTQIKRYLSWPLMTAIFFAAAAFYLTYRQPYAVANGYRLNYVQYSHTLYELCITFFYLGLS